MAGKDDEKSDDTRPRRPGLLTHLRSNFLAGLIIIVPVALTIWLIWTVIGVIDGWVLPLVPDRLEPSGYIVLLLRNYLGIELPPDQNLQIRGLGVIVFLVFTIVVGWLAKGFFGRSLIRISERLVDRTPVVRSIYNGLKQIVETALSQSNSSFDKAVLVQYPRKGIWAIAFVSTSAKGEVRERLPEDDPVLSVFLPTTPNPTSGFLLFVPEADIIYLDMSVEDAAKLVISAGLVYPNQKRPSIGIAAPDDGASETRRLSRDT